MAGKLLQIGRATVRGLRRVVGHWCALALSLCLSAAPAHGQINLSQLFAPRGSPAAPASTVPHPAIARIMVQEGKSISYGSGSLIHVWGDYGMVVTNWHVVRDRDAKTPVTVHFPDGFYSPAIVVKEDKNWDLAALSIWKPRVAALPISPTPPQPGERLTIAGYGSGDFRAAAGLCTQYLSPGKNFPFELVEVGVQARNGDSGGPILNERGEIAGVLLGSNRSITTGSYGGRVLQFLADVTPTQPPPNEIGNPIVEPPQAAPPAAFSPAGNSLQPFTQPPLDTPFAKTISPEQPELNQQLQAMSGNPAAAIFQLTPNRGEATDAASDDGAPPKSTAPATTGGLISVPAKGDVKALSTPRWGTHSAADEKPVSPANRIAAKSFSSPAPSAFKPLTPRKGQFAADQENGDEAQNTPTLELLATIWKQVGGTTAADQFKTILAGIGLIALLVLFWRNHSHPDTVHGDE